ncbi:MAG: hypothetical protein LBH05_07095 [Deferribacteraceae bacterium]|jgi:dimethylargininase|nr:hypothetical protein [Deferribacteraceae bacterium]
MDKIFFTKAITRLPGEDFANGLTTSGLGLPDLSLAVNQHTEYISALKRLNIDVDVLPPLSGMPDACFVEDTAIVTEETAVITHPGAVSRTGETDSISAVLSQYKSVRRINGKGATIDGGDVLLVGDTFFVGISNRTNRAGMDEFAAILTPYNRYKFVPVEVADGLHLKSGVTQIAPYKLFITKELADNPAFTPYKKVIVPDGEEYAANTLLINGTLLMSGGFPKSAQVCKDEGCKVIVLNMSEYRKMDGALTCLSLRF